MKGFFVIFALALVASAAASPNRGIVEDALELKRCVEAVMHDAQNDIDTIVSTLGGMTEMIASYYTKWNACQAIGGENPSVIDQIQSAQCLINLANSFREEVNAAVEAVQISVADLAHTKDKLELCF